MPANNQSKSQKQFCQREILKEYLNKFFCNVLLKDKAPWVVINKLTIMFCTKCGNQIKDGYKFCPKCGTPTYVEKEAPKSEVINVVNEFVVEPKTESDNRVTSTLKAKILPKAKILSEAKKTDNDPKPQSQFISDLLILEELDIEGVIAKAKKGDKEAMLRQAFRYEVGIGCVMNKEIAVSLYEKVKDDKDYIPIDDIKYKSIIGLE